PGHRLRRHGVAGLGGGAGNCLGTLDLRSRWRRAERGPKYSVVKTSLSQPSTASARAGRH
ncbi:hypothetical protein ABK046_52380, partial [Streptomyces caeruleatus]